MLHKSPLSEFEQSLRAFVAPVLHLLTIAYSRSCRSLSRGLQAVWQTAATLALLALEPFPHHAFALP